MIGLAFAALFLAGPASARSYTVQGETAAIKWRGPTEGAPRTIVYYVPRSIEKPFDPAARAKVLVLLHGGGASTMTDPSATAAAELYVKDFATYAETRRTVIIAPTAPFGWGQQEILLFPRLLQAAAGELGLDLERAVLAGHSMGGMAITRDYPYLTHVFAGFLAISAGTQDYVMTEDCLLAYLNGTPYIHQNGRADHFTTFDGQQRKLVKKLAELEKRRGAKARYSYHLSEDGHDYDLDRSFAQLDELFSRPRERFPKRIFVNLSYLIHAAVPMRGAPRIEGAADSMFWIKALDYAKPILAPDAAAAGTGVQLEAVVRGQKIDLTSRGDTLKAKKYEITLSSRLLDLTKPLVVTFDGQEVFRGPPPAASGEPKLVFAAPRK